MLQENPAFHYWLYMTVFFFFKMWSNSLIQGLSRLKGNAFRYDEDQKAFGKEKDKDSKYADLEMRATNCWRNDLENIPIFLVLSLALVIMGASSKICLIYFSVYVVARIFHSVFLIKAKQPIRAIFFMMGIFTTIVVGGHGIYLTLQ